MANETETVDENCVEDNRRCPTIGEFVGFVSLVVLIAVAFSIWIFALPVDHTITKGDCEKFSYPVVRTWFNWNIFLLVMSSFTVVSTTLWIELIPPKPTPYNEESYIRLFNRCLTYFRLCLTLGNGVLITMIVGLISSYVSGIPAPNFIFACLDPGSFISLCVDLPQMGLTNLYTAVRQVKPKCQNSPSLWIPAMASSPSTSAAIQAFLMTFLALYVYYRMKEPAIKRYLKYFLQLVALTFLWGTGVAVVSRNEATWIAVLIGYVIGIIVAVLTIGLTREWLEWMKEKPGLPFYVNDKDFTIKQPAQPQPPPDNPNTSTMLTNENIQPTIPEIVRSPAPPVATLPDDQKLVQPTGPEPTTIPTTPTPAFPPQQAIQVPQNDNNRPFIK